MKKTTYILSLLTAVFLISCGNSASSGTVKAEAVLSGKTVTANITNEMISLPDSKDYADSSNNNATENETDAVEITTETEEDTLPEYTVTEFEETKTMYASDPVNVRRGPSTDYEIVGFLGLGQEVSAIGQADTEWYEIQYGEDTAFVSNKYLQDELPLVETAAANLEEDIEGRPETGSAQNPGPADSGSAPAQPDAPQTVPEVKNVAGVILVGDSRFVQMKNSVGDNPCTWIAESSKGYNWFSENAIPRIDSCVGKGSKILINLGVNDTNNLQKYISLVNAKADEWVSKGAVVYYSSVNPVWENPYVNEEQVEYFNSQMQSSLNSNVHWIDSHSYLNSIGYKLVDGLHFSEDTYRNLYAYYMNCL